MLAGGTWPDSADVTRLPSLLCGVSFIAANDDSSLTAR